MTTDDGSQLTLQTYERELDLLRQALEIRLASIQAWVKLPNDDVDWKLETLLLEIGSYADAYRRIRNELEIPF